LRVERRGPAEGAGRLVVVEGVDQRQPLIKETLRLGVPGRDRVVVRAQSGEQRRRPFLGRSLVVLSESRESQEAEGENEHGGFHMASLRLRWLNDLRHHADHSLAGHGSPGFAGRTVERSLTIPQIEGKTQGLKPNQLRRLEKMYQRRIP